MPLKALIIAEDDVDEIELLYAYYRLREEGFDVFVAASRKFSSNLITDEKGNIVKARRKLRGKRGIEIPVDIDFKEALDRVSEWDVLIIPGGRGPDRARQYGEAVELVRRIHDRGKPILAICHGPQLLISAGIINGKRVTGYPGIKDDLINAGAIYTGDEASRDGNIVTVRHTSTLAEGMREFVKLLRELGIVK